jgi:hypothetical protein
VSVTVPEGYIVAWILRGMDVIRSVTQNGHTYNDVICNLTFRLRVMNQHKRTVTIDNSVELVLDPDVTPETYTEFNKLTKNEATAWFESAISESVRDQMVTRALAQLQNQDHMYFAPVPWYIQDPVAQ